jgi:hypothetical protein
VKTGRWTFACTLCVAFAIPVLLGVGAPKGLPVFGVTALLTLVLAARAAKTLGWGTTSIIVLGLVPPILFMAGVLLCATIDRPIPADGVALCVGAAPVLFTASLIAAEKIQRFVRKLDARKRERIISGCVHTLAVLAAVAVLLSTVKRLRHPDPEQIRAGIEKVGTLPNHTEELPLIVNPPPLLIDKGSLHIRAHGRPEHSGCIIGVADDGQGVSGEFLYAPKAPIGCIGVLLLRVPALRLWMVTPALERGFSHRPLTAGYVEPTFAYREATLVAFRSDIAPPLSWTCEAAVGVCAGIALLTRKNRRLLALQRWREEDIGGVPVLVNPDAPAPTYRSALQLDDPAVVEKTTLAAVQRELSEWNTGRCAFALAVMATASAPLAAACWLGFAV